MMEYWNDGIETGFGDSTFYGLTSTRNRNGAAGAGGGSRYEVVEETA